MVSFEIIWFFNIHVSAVSGKHVSGEWELGIENEKRMDGEFWHQSVGKSHQYTCLSCEWELGIEKVSFDISEWDLREDKRRPPLPPEITKETRKFNLNLNRFPFRYCDDCCEARLRISF